MPISEVICSLQKSALCWVATEIRLRLNIDFRCAQVIAVVQLSYLWRRPRNGSNSESNIYIIMPISILGPNKNTEIVFSALTFGWICFNRHQGWSKSIRKLALKKTVSVFLWSPKVEINSQRRPLFSLLYIHAQTKPK